MIQKPPRWNVSPALIEATAGGLWKGAALVAPMWDAAGGKGALLGAHGGPLAGANLVAGSTAEKRATPYGLGVGISGSSNLLTQDDFDAIVTSSGAGLGDFTIVCLANPVAEARASAGVSQAVNGVVDGNMTALAFNTTGASNFAASSGTFAFMTRTTGGTIASVSGAIDGKYHLFGGRRNSGGITAWIDGVIGATNTGAARDILAAGADFSIGHIAGSASTGRIDTGCNIVFAAAWNRALSDAEMRLLARDPFCMFRMAQVSPSLWAAAGAYFINADPGGFAITGVAAGAISARMISAVPAAYALTGFSAATPAGRAITADPGAYAITGLPAGVIADRVINAAPASFSITGIAAGVLAGRALSADPGALVITGAAADLVYTVSGAFSLNADPGAFSVTGAAAGTIAGRVIDALAGGYSVTGLAASIVAGRALSADPGAYTITGTNAGVLAGRVITAEPGVYTVTGASAGAIAARLMAADPGAYVITGLTATFATGLGVQTYAAQILIMSDAREIIIIDDAREIVVG